MALATRADGTDRRPSTLSTLWRSTVGKKAVMAVTGAVMLSFLIAHMVGNLKIFFGPGDFDDYAAWLRTIGKPVLHGAWFLWIMRAGLAASVVLHAVTAYQLSRRDRAARPVGYVHRRQRTSYATRTMRWGGVILGLFIVWHLLDLTALTVNPRGQEGHPYENIVADFRNWYADVIYIVAMLALGLHVRHGFLSATRTLGSDNPRHERVLRFTGEALALLLTAGFVVVPVSVMTGLVS